MDIQSFIEDYIAEICAKPTWRLFDTLNEIIEEDYYDGWCEYLDLVKIEITKDDHIIYITTWANDCEINDCITIRPYEDFTIIKKIMRSVEEY